MLARLASQQAGSARACWRGARCASLVAPRAVASAGQQTKTTMAAQQEDAGVYHMGQSTLRISRKDLHGKIRARFLEAFRAALAPKQGAAPGVVLLQGGDPFHVYSTDGEGVFRQESYFHYCFGVNEESWYGAIDVATGAAHLFMPRLPEVYAVWMGPLKGPEDFKKKYEVEAVHYVEDMPQVLKQLLAAQGASKGSKPGPVHVLHGTNTDSGMDVKGASFEGIADFEVEKETLFPVLAESRVKKSEEEIAIIRYANQIGAEGHVAMMRKAAPGLMEYQLEADYLHTVYSKGGCRLPNYTPISASGPNGAVLHYGHAGAPNDRQLKEGDLVLVDMGCEYYRYGSDITCTWPANGKFTGLQRDVYNAVLKAHQSVIKAMAPGISWPDMQTLAYRTILEGLKGAGIVQGEVEEMLQAEVGALFMPHGLGHFLGIDTHDVGGYGPDQPPRSTRPGYKSLRTARKLEPGMVITVEPGCYFSPALLVPALQNPAHSKFLVESALAPLIGTFGGVRIEDNVVVTATGSESLTHVPRTVEEIEAVMAGAPWPLPAK